MSTSHKMLIDGRLIDGDHSLDVINPATAKPFVSVARASERQVEEAVSAARKAQPDWAALPLTERQAAVNKMADLLEGDIERFVRALVQEQGKPVSEAEMEVGYMVVFLRYWASVSLPVEVLQDDDDLRIELHYRPLGVVAGIAPWNFPIITGFNKIAPAIITGNTVVLKPAPTTPVTTLMFGELVKDVVPPGVINIVVDDNDLGALLTSHPDIDKVSFTGSTATGKKVFSSAASTLKRITLELGGNDAAVVLEDVDVQSTAESIVNSAFMNAGQTCIAIKRVYVADPIYDEMCSAMANFVSTLPVGDGFEQGVRIGPMQNLAQYEKAKGYLADAANDGTIIAGGKIRDGDGYFIEPTLVRDIKEDSPLVQEEQFSPILPIMRFSDVNEVIERANATKMGLGGSIWSGSQSKAYDYSAKIDSGTVWINHHTHFAPNIPVGGAKDSGIGVEFSTYGLAEFCQKVVVSLKK